MSRRTIRPACETLENRDVPSVTLQTLNNGHTLKITGTSDWENVRIVENGQTGTLDVFYNLMPKADEAMELTVQQASYSASAITKIQVDLKAGDDVFTYELAPGTNLTVSRQWVIDMGSGNDSVKVDTASLHTVLVDAGTSAVQDGDWWTIESPPTDRAKGDADISNVDDTGHSVIDTRLAMTINMGAGDDTLNFVLGEVAQRGVVRLTSTLGDGDDSFLLSSDLDLGERSTLQVDVNAGKGKDNVSAQFTGHVADRSLVDLLFRGGDGNDSLDAGFTGTLDGRFNLRMYGGDGQDRLSLITDSNPDSTGMLSFMMFGNGGHDVMTYQTLGGDDPTLVSALMDGGANRNVARYSFDIECFNCTERIRLAPMPPWA